MITALLNQAWEPDKSKCKDYLSLIKSNSFYEETEDIVHTIISF
jgi:hypothetical protein